MCVIAGYMGNKQAAPVLLKMLQQEEGLGGGYYSGIATIHEGKLHYEKVVGDAGTLIKNTSAMHLLGTSLAGAVGLLDPEMIVVTGGVAAAIDLLEPMILSALCPQLPPHLRDIRIAAGRFGPQASLYGAALAGSAGPDWGAVA